MWLRSGGGKRFGLRRCDGGLLGAGCLELNGQRFVFSYNEGVKTKRMADCHPDLPHWSRGMCGTCYQRWWNKENPGRTRARVKARENPATCHPEKQELARGLCQTCYRRWWRLENPGKEWVRQNHANTKRYRSLDAVEKRDRSLKKYGLTAESYDSLLATQGGVCAVCKVPSTRRLEVDHCHQSGKVRSILCHNCNSALGHAKDDVKRLEALIQYLSQHQAPEAECSPNPSGPAV